MEQSSYQPIKPVVVNYNNLSKCRDDLENALKTHGFVAISEVPDFKSIFGRFLENAIKFVNLPEEDKDKCKPENYYSHGWSFGEEIFNEKLDAYKGSYYADLPQTDQNIWPHILPEFEKAYMDLGNLIFNTGIKILEILELKPDTLQCKCRMLYYGQVPQDDKNDNPNWCGLHRDHGLFTGLCPAVYIKDGKIVDKPEGTGLFIRDKEIDAPNDVLLFQVGEVAHLISDGKIIATDHYVKKAYGVERITLATFMSPLDNYVIESNDHKEYDDRYKEGITYGEWCEKSYKKYYKM